MASSDTASIEPLLESRQRFVEYVRRRVSDPELAEDIVQESLLRALRAAPKLREEEKLIPWFFQVLRNSIVDEYRKRDAARRHVSGSNTLPDLAEETDEDERTVCECFRPLLSNLKPEYAQVLEVLEFGEETSASAADRLGITPANLKVRRHRARQALRQQLEAVCATLGEDPPRVNMNVSAYGVPNGMRIEWDAIAGVDVGYLAETTPERADGLSSWMGSGVTAPGIGRLSAFIPVPQIAARWCVRVMPVYRATVNLALSEEPAALKPDTAPDPSTPSATREATPIAPSGGTGEAASGGPQPRELTGGSSQSRCSASAAVCFTRS